QDRQHPGDRSNRELETRLPVHRAPSWILRDPGLYLRDGFARITFVAGKEECLCQARQVLMTVQFMNDFCVAWRAFHEVVIGPILSRPLQSRNRVAIPVDLIAKWHIAVPKNVQAMLQEAFRVLN